MIEVKVLGIDLSKSVFQLHGVDKKGKIVLKKRLNRKKFQVFMKQLPCCLVGMEACGGSHYWARMFQSWGHDVRLMPAQYVKAYVKSQKNDAKDAEAICEAVLRPNMHFVAIKTVAQQEILCIHRVRARLVRHRTALSNEIRGLLGEFGVSIVKGFCPLRKFLVQLISPEDGCWSDSLKAMFQELYEEFLAIEKRIVFYDDQIKISFQSHELSRRLEKIPGIGILTATAMVASMGSADHFKNGRQVSAWLGLVPKQYSSGHKLRLGKISKRGDTYLRWLLIHGGRSVVYRLNPNKKDRFSLWLQQLVKRRGKNRAAVALANHNARVIWAMMKTGQSYRPLDEHLKQAA